MPAKPCETPLQPPDAVEMKNPEPLASELREAETTLKSTLDAACAKDVTRADTGELIRVEETLAVASEAAKQAVSVRLKLREQRGKDPVRAMVRDESGEKVTHRVFEDVRGKRWHAFAVQGSQETAERASLPDSFRSGWLVFESDDELRRVAPIPEKWEELDTDALRELCFKAPAAPRRVNRER